ncbi:MAG: hypothetical protein AAF598_02070 [Bacteroidota bacterium]
MTGKLVQFAAILLSLNLFSCRKIDKAGLVGAWQGIGITVDGALVRPDASDFQLVMRGDETYTLTTLNGITENGTYESRMGTLYLNSENGRRAFIMDRQTNDTLDLKVDWGRIGILQVVRRF